jgi:hypothetical protein
MFDWDLGGRGDRIQIEYTYLVIPRLRAKFRFEGFQLELELEYS